MKPEVVLIEIENNATGAISIMSFVTRGVFGPKGVEDREPSTENIDAEITKSGVDISSVNWRKTTVDKIPATREFRNEWRRSGQSIDVDIPLARIAFLGRIRKARDAALISMDARWVEMSSRGDADAVAIVEAQKTDLRDLPATVQPALAAATTPDELVAAWPALALEG